MKTELLMLIATLLGGLIGLAGNWISKYFEDRRAKRDLIIKGAIEHWSRHAEICVEVWKKAEKGTKISQAPLTNYIIAMTKLMDLVSKKKINEIDLKEKISEIYKFEKIIEEFYATERNAGLK